MNPKRNRPDRLVTCIDFSPTPDIWEELHELAGSQKYQTTFSAIVREACQRLIRQEKKAKRKAAQ